jgi:hypothetical protein
MAENCGTKGGNTPNDNHDKSKKRYHWVYVAGWCLFSAFIDFAFLWPESHFWALLALAAALSLPAIYQLTVLGVSARWVVSSVASLFAASLCVYWVVGPIRIPYIEMIGSLQPGNKPTPSNGCDRPRPPGFPNIPGDALKILIGDNAFVLTGAVKFTVLQIGQCPVLSMERNESGIWFNADVYDKDGRLVARVVNNETHIMTGENVSDDRHGDLTVLVVKSKEDELLYVRYLNPTTVQARGVFGCPGHQPVIVRDNEPMPRVLMAHVCAVDPEIGIKIP